MANHVETLATPSTQAEVPRQTAAGAPRLRAIWRFCRQKPLGALGGVARDQCKQLAAIARSNPYDSTVMTPKQMEQMVAYEDLRRAAKAAMAKIGC